MTPQNYRLPAARCNFVKLRMSHVNRNWQFVRARTCAIVNFALAIVLQQLDIKNLWNKIKLFKNLCFEKFLTDRTAFLSPPKKCQNHSTVKNAVLLKCNFSFAPIQSRSIFCATAIDHFFTMQFRVLRCIWIIFFRKMFYAWQRHAQLSSSICQIFLVDRLEKKNSVHIESSFDGDQFFVEIYL